MIIGNRYVVTFKRGRLRYFFLYVQFWIRLAAESYRGKEVRTVASFAVRSVNKSRDTQHCVQNEAKYASDLFMTRSYYKDLGIILCDWYGKYTTITIVLTMATVMLQVTARCQRWARPVSWWQPWKFGNYVIVWGNESCFSFCKTYLTWNWLMGFTLWCCLWINLISNFGRFYYWSVQSGIHLFPFDWDRCGEYQQPITQVGGV